MGTAWTYGPMLIPLSEHLLSAQVLLTIYHLLSVYSLTLDPTFTRAYSGSKDNTIRVWNLQTG